MSAILSACAVEMVMAFADYDSVIYMIPSCIETSYWNVIKITVDKVYSHVYERAPYLNMK